MVRLDPLDVEIFEYVSNGYKDADIAEILHLSYDGLRSRIERALKGNGCRNRTELVARAIRDGVLKDGKYPERKRYRQELRAAMRDAFSIHDFLIVSGRST